MKALFGLIAASLLAGPAFAGDVSASISIGQPGFYGRIDIGDAPPPVLLYREPIVVIRSVQPAEPVYLRVPPGHAKDWPKFCAQYGACDRPAYFVQDSWYNEVYVPHHHKRQGRGPDGEGNRGKGQHKDKGR